MSTLDQFLPLMNGHVPQLDPKAVYRATSKDDAMGWAQAQTHILEEEIRITTTVTTEDTRVETRVEVAFKAARFILAASASRLWDQKKPLTTPALRKCTLDVMTKMADYFESEEAAK